MVWWYWSGKCSRGWVALGLAAGAVFAARANGDSGIAAVRLAQKHFSSVLIVQRWAALAYDLHPPREKSCKPSFTDPVTNPDGSTTFGFVNADCSAGTETNSPDGGFEVRLRHPDGLREHVQGESNADHALRRRRLPL